MNHSDPSSRTPVTSQAPAASDPNVTYEPSQEIVRAELSEPAPEQTLPRKRRVRLPIILFVLTCASTFLAGATGYLPHIYALRAVGLMGWPPSAMPLRQAIYAGWSEGVLYMLCVLAILLTHEMGHFVMTLVYRVRASWPFFIPFPISPIGTMGAVIAMDSRSANRREIFDIGLAGPIAGLLVALPIMWIGVQNIDLEPSPNELTLQAPLAMRLAIDYVHPGKYNPSVGFPLTRANAWFMAGWVGLLVTGLNMLPVSQLDGGHVTYALFGRAAHWIARGFMLLAVVYMGLMYYVYGTQPTYVLMAILVLVIGTDHPRTSDDTAHLGPWRIALGCVSLLIPIFCFVPNLQL